MITIRDVAQRAQVSTSTVSHVINGTRPVSETTRQRVMDAMAVLDYQPNRLARSLRNRRTNTLGVLLPNSANPYFAQILAGIEDACFEYGYNIVLGNANDDPQREISYLEILLSKQVDGILLVSTGAYQQVLDLLATRGVPLVMVDRSPGQVYDGWQVDTVITDNVVGGALATDYLLDLGHRRIGCVTGPAWLTSSTGRVEGYQLAMRRAGLAPDPALIVEGDFEHDGGYAAGVAFLKMPDRPSAIFACNDLMAVGVLCAAYELGLRVPEDVSVIGFDGIPLSSYTVPRLTTISQPGSALGRTAVDHLIKRLADRNASERHSILPVSLTIRDSCAAFRS